MMKVNKNPNPERNRKMDEHELQNALQTLLVEIACMDEADREDAGLGGKDLAGARVETFADAGVLTNNAGLCWIGDPR